MNKPGPRDPETGLTENQEIRLQMQNIKQSLKQKFDPNDEFMVAALNQLATRAFNPKKKISLTTKMRVVKVITDVQAKYAAMEALEAERNDSRHGQAATFDGRTGLQDDDARAKLLELARRFSPERVPHLLANGNGSRDNATAGDAAADAVPGQVTDVPDSQAM